MMAEGATGSMLSGCSAGCEIRSTPELAEHQSRCLMHRVGDAPPRLDLLAAVNARRPGIALTLHGHLRRLADNQRSRGALRLVAGRERTRHVARLTGARACQRRHDHPMGQIEWTKTVGLEQRSGIHLPARFWRWCR